MNLNKSHWKRALLLVAALMLVVSVTVGCNGEEETTEPTTTPTTTVTTSEPTTDEPTEKPTLIMADTQFESIWIINAVTEYMIENGYDYPVDIIVMTTPIAQASLAQGDVDIWMELWQQNWADNYAEEVAAGNIENMGMVYEGGPQFFLIPKWVADEYNIVTIFDMIDHWELFKDPEDPDKGAFINCIIGWQCQAINQVKLEAYGLTEYYNIIAPGSSGAMEAALAGAQKKDEPIFGYYWAPTALMGLYDWYILEEPEYDADIWAEITAAKDDESLRPLSEACAYETLPVDIGINPGLRDKAPDVVELLGEIMIGLEALNRTAAWSKENEVQDWEEAAIWYLNEYEADWKAWVTDDAYDEIKDALATEG